MFSLRASSPVVDEQLSITFGGSVQPSGLQIVRLGRMAFLLGRKFVHGPTSSTLQLGLLSVRQRLLHSVVESGVLIDEAFLFISEVIGGVDGIRGTYRHAGPAIDTASGIHIELGRCLENRFILLGMNAIRRANVNTKDVLDAGIGNHIGHDAFS
jgi:hypothetical protein